MTGGYHKWIPVNSSVVDRPQSSHLAEIFENFKQFINSSHRFIKTKEVNSFKYSKQNPQTRINATWSVLHVECCRLSSAPFHCTILYFIISIIFDTVAFLRCYCHFIDWTPSLSLSLSLVLSFSPSLSLLSLSHSLSLFLSLLSLSLSLSTLLSFSVSLSIICAWHLKREVQWLLSRFLDFDHPLFQFSYKTVSFLQLDHLYAIVLRWHSLKAQRSYIYIYRPKKLNQWFRTKYSFLELL